MGFYFLHLKLLIFYATTEKFIKTWPLRPLSNDTICFLFFKNTYDGAAIYSILRTFKIKILETLNFPQSNPVQACPKVLKVGGAIALDLAKGWRG